MKRSTHVCQRCGLPVTACFYGYRHTANRHTKSCGKPPVVITREKHEADLAAMASAANDILATWRG